MDALEPRQSWDESRSSGDNFADDASMDADSDSALGDEVASETTSIASSVYHYEYENGRRYHAYRAGEYPIPNDEAEQDRLDMLHHLCLLISGGELYRAPIANVDRVLDIGTGTGKWAIDFADMNPSASVVACDLSVIQPDWVPPNVQFEIDNVEEEWQYGEPFDYIHIRSMGGSISDWPRLMKQVYDNLKPGGWVEVVDFEAWATTDDNSLPETSAYHEFQTRLSEAAQSFGKVMNISPQFKSFVTDAAFTNVSEVKHKAPLSPWPKDPKARTLGKYMTVQMNQSIEAYSLALFTRVLKWSPERTQTLLAGVRKDLANLDYHMYSVLHIVLGQKPLE